MYFAGIDIGSTVTKAVVINEAADKSPEDLFSSLVYIIGPTGPEHRSLANMVMQQTLDRAGLTLDRIAFIVATGYGRLNVPFADRRVTEITCHARAIAELFPSARTMIDVGGQDSKAIKLKKGKVVDFAMNDKCAAGTGRFLEVIAEALGLTVEDLGETSLRSRNPLKISSTCTIFAEQEVLSHLSEGAAIEDIVSGLHEAIASRVFALVQRLKIEKDVVLTGGGAKNIGLVKALERRLGFPVLIPSEPLLTGALGAALLGRDYVHEEGYAPPPQARRLEKATLYD